jgi:hypothetical protein
MAHKRCPSGQHVYDTDKHTFCPFCTPSPLPEPPVNPVNKTTLADNTPVRASVEGKTRVIIGGGLSTSSVSAEQAVGWLVVINGKGRGRDLRIPPGQSKIGREQGDIVLNFGDTSISRDKHAMLAYDPQENIFFISCGDGRNPTKVNGKMLINTKVLNPFDRIRFGNTDLLFVPLCGDNFTWEQGRMSNQSVVEPVQTAGEASPNVDSSVKTKFIFE